MAEIVNPFLVKTAPTLLSTEPLARAGGLITPVENPTIGPSILVDNKDHRADLLWGASKKGKGIQAWFGAHWMMKTHGKKFLYLTAEPGSMPSSISNAIRAGWGSMFSLVSPESREHLLAILSTILEAGKWPVQFKANDGTMRYDFKSKESQCDPDQNGLLIVDSGTSIGDELIRWMAQPSNRAVIPMSPGEDKFNIRDAVDGGSSVHYHGSSPTHVGESCRLIQQYVVASANLPYDKVLWIMREQRASRGEKKDKAGNILVAGEPMYGPDLPGTAATPRVTSWFGAAYHCDAVPVAGEKDDRQDAGSGLTMLPSVTDRLTTIPNWEYRIYMRPHPDPKTGILYDAGNRLPAHVNADPKYGRPFIKCTETKVGKEFVHTGLNTIWEMERTLGTNDVDDMREDLATLLAKFNKKG